jgi:UDP-glucose 4-epimerase
MSDWIFITGGSGYVGSHIAAAIKEKTDNKIMIIDSRSKQLQHTVKFCDIYADEDFSSKTVHSALMDYKPVAVIHCAATSTIPKGISDPADMWKNNVVKTIGFLESCVSASVKNVLFASSSAVYADCNDAVTEESLIAPISTYASTKLTVEHILRDFNTAYGLNSVSLRFFNAAGAHPIYDLGELHGGSHLMSKIMESAVHGLAFNVFGRDWPTPDGTCIRDYTHVCDIADGCLAALEWMKTNNGIHYFNIGTGHGYSVQEMIDRTELLLSKELPYRYLQRRPGDTAKRVASSTLLEKYTGWKPTRTLDNIIRDSWKWYNSHTYDILTRTNIWAE